MNQNTPTEARHRRLLLHALPLAAVSVAAFAAGVLVSGDSTERGFVDRFAHAWTQGDYAAMRAELAPASRASYSPEDLEAAYAAAMRTATSTGISTGEPRGPLEQDGESVVALPVAIETVAFGTVSGEIGIPVSDEGIEWRPELVFPGLAEGEKLERNSKLPKRAPILAADRSPLAEGPADARTTNGTSGVVTGELAQPDRERQREMSALGFPKDTPAGDSGLELAFDSVLAGTPGGELLASGGAEDRVLAARDPVDGEALRTTIDPKLQDATAAALGATFGGAALLDARNGDVLGLAGVAFSAPQPPGSTFKVITTTGALEAKITKLGEEFPVTSGAVVGGREVANADDELCGGNLVQSFAESCNSVFAPLGAELGGPKLVRTAELFGFNSPPSLYRPEALVRVDPPESTIPTKLGDDLTVGVSAIGQGEVLATPLEMASVAQTIANDGVRSPTSLVRDPELAGPYPDVTVTTPEVAGQLREMMIEVVKSGTGVAAALPDATVAGKTGTAELGTSSGEAIGDVEAAQDVDAWFTAFAPAGKPKYAVAVMVVNAGGDGGTIAAPIARAILDAAL